MSVAALEELSVGKRIRWARKNAGLSQDRLAALIPTTRQVIIRWEKDRHLPNEKSRERLADATGQEPELFLEHRQVDDSEEAVLQRQAREMVAPFQDGDGRRAARGVQSASRRKGGG